VITDDELLAAVRSAGKPGSGPHREACRLYRRSVLEWREQSPAWQAERERREALRERDDALRRLVALVARRAEAQALRDAAECGSRSGYHRHLREGTVICLRCRIANRDYDRPRKRAERLAAATVRERLAEAA
jgi:hypothetical protein